MAWKLKKSKVEDNGGSAEAIPSVVITHGHSAVTPPPHPDVNDDFFSSRLSEVDEAVNSLHDARETPFDDNDFMSEHPIPDHDEIPVIQSAFVTHEETHTDHAEPEHNSYSMDDVRPERAPIDFGDVEFNVDQEPETLEFGSPQAELQPEIDQARIDMSGSHTADPNQTLMMSTPPAPVEDLDKTVMLDTPTVPVEDLDKTVMLDTPSAPVEDLDKTVMMDAPTAQVEVPNETVVMPTPVASAPVEPPTAIVAQVSQTVTPTKVLIKLGPFTAEHELTGELTNLVIGRPDYNTGESPAISVELDDAISRRHARIILQDGQYKIEDLGSKNGTLINGQLLMANVPMPFNIGDIVKVGERTELTLKA